MKLRLGLDEHRLPVLLPLRDFARYLEKECPKLLLDYLRTCFTHQNITLPPDFFAALLKAGECAVCFDGVDEVASMSTRQRVARILEKFTLVYPANRYVVTSRIVGYTGGARLGADYAVTTVALETRPVRRGARYRAASTAASRSGCAPAPSRG